MKRPHKSKTIIFNAVLGSVVALAAVAQDFLPLFEIEDTIRNGVLAASAGIGAVGNTILRFMTDSPIGYSEES